MTKVSFILHKRSIPYGSLIINRSGHDYLMLLSKYGNPMTFSEPTKKKDERKGR